MDNIVTIPYKTVLTALAKDEVPLHRFVPIHRGTVREDSVYAAVSKSCGLPQPLVKATTTMLFDEIGDCLKHGYRVEFPQMDGEFAELSKKAILCDPPALYRSVCERQG